MAKEKRDKPPPGGWMGPPPTTGLKALREFVPGKKGKKGKWIDIPQTKKDKELRKEWERRNAKAEAKGNWHFKWPPADLRK
jgi:hypothetical protein